MMLKTCLLFSSVILLHGAKAHGGQHKQVGKCRDGHLELEGLLPQTEDAEKIESLGDGNYGDVVLMQHEGNVYAVKFCKQFAEKHMDAGSQALINMRADNKERRDQAANEVNVLHILQSGDRTCPNIVLMEGYNRELPANHDELYHETKPHHEAHVIWFQQLGDNLRKYVLKNLEKNIEKELIEIWLGVANGLQFMHERGILHNDLHLGNVCLKRETNTACLIDFGLSQIKDDVAPDMPGEHFFSYDAANFVTDIMLESLKLWHPDGEDCYAEPTEVLEALEFSYHKPLLKLLTSAKCTKYRLKEKYSEKHAKYAKWFGVIATFQDSSPELPEGTPLLKLSEVIRIINEMREE